MHLLFKLVLLSLSRYICW